MKLILDSAGSISLYDLETDPDELTDLSGHPESQAQVERLLVALRSQYPTLRFSL